MGHRIGIDLGGTKIEGILLDPAGKESLRLRIDTPAGDYPATIEAIKHMVTTLEAETTLPSGEATVGLGIPGTLSPGTGLIKNANSTCLIGKPLNKDLEAALNRPVRLANDANCFALSEATDGAGRNFSVVFGVILGTGVGGGLVVDGNLLTGPNSIAGEWGHNPLPWPAGRNPNQPPPADLSCYCGKVNCIETFLSGPGFINDFGDPTVNRVEEIIVLADQGHLQAITALERYEQRLAAALASVINIIDPDVIVLGGGLSNIDRLYDTVPAQLSQFAFGGEATTPIVKNTYGDSSGVRGAAWLWPSSINDESKKRLD